VELIERICAYFNCKYVEHLKQVIAKKVAWICTRRESDRRMWAHGWPGLWVLAYGVLFWPLPADLPQGYDPPSHYGEAASL
jgi:hypothetical protein